MAAMPGSAVRSACATVKLRLLCLCALGQVAVLTPARPNQSFPSTLVGHASRQGSSHSSPPPSPASLMPTQRLLRFSARDAPTVQHGPTPQAPHFEPAQPTRPPAQVRVAIIATAVIIVFASVYLALLCMMSNGLSCWVGGHRSFKTRNIGLQLKAAFIIFHILAHAWLPAGPRLAISQQAQGGMYAPTASQTPHAPPATCRQWEWAAHEASALVMAHLLSYMPNPSASGTLLGANTKWYMSSDAWQEVAEFEYTWGLHTVAVLPSTTAASPCHDTWIAHASTFQTATIEQCPTSESAFAVQLQHSPACPGSYATDLFQWARRHAVPNAGNGDCFFTWRWKARFKSEAETRGVLLARGPTPPTTRQYPEARPPPLEPTGQRRTSSKWMRSCSASLRTCRRVCLCCMPRSAWLCGSSRARPLGSYQHPSSGMCGSTGWVYLPCFTRKTAALGSWAILKSYLS